MFFPLLGCGNVSQSEAPVRDWEFLLYEIELAFKAQMGLLARVALKYGVTLD